LRTWFEDRSEHGASIVIPGTAFGDIALVPAPYLKHPKGIRDIEEWYVSTAIRKDLVLAIFDRQCEVALKNIEKMIEILGDTVQSAVVTGTDFGTQRGLFCSIETYRELYKPYHIAVNKLIHERSNWKTFSYTLSQTFPMLLEWIKPSRTFGIYAGVSAVCMMFVWACVPETKGRTLEEIEQEWLQN